MVLSVLLYLMLLSPLLLNSATFSTCAVWKYCIIIFHADFENCFKICLLNVYAYKAKKPSLTIKELPVYKNLTRALKL